MPRIYTWRFEVRSYELDTSGWVRPSTYLNYLEEGAWNASAAAGYTPAWYNAHNRIWVLRTMNVRYFTPVTMGEQLELSTWVSDFRRVQSHREYDLRRVRDGQRVLRARGNWAFLDAQTLQPQRLPDQVILDFAPDNIQEDLDSRVIDPVTVEQPVVHTSQRRVERRDLDSLGHVNNGTYLAWADQALADALRAAGWPPQRLASSDFSIIPIADEIEYVQSAHDDDPICVTTRLAQVGRDRAAWLHEITHGATGELMTRVLSVRAFRDANGSRSIPDALHLSLVARA